MEIRGYREIGIRQSRRRCILHTFSKCLIPNMFRSDMKRKAVCTPACSPCAAVFAVTRLVSAASMYCVVVALRVSRNQYAS
ncbi:hypothetical protein SUGI_1043330 [Cryptomeria japonica]|nr:hypothetical protein SUGI_1043330 [Cryptomeria japonica]